MKDLDTQRPECNGIDFKLRDRKEERFGLKRVSSKAVESMTVLR